MWWKRARLAASWLVALYMTQLVVPMGVVKFDPDGFWTAAFDRWGYPVWFRLLVGAIETAGGVMLVIPWLASWGGLAVTAVMVGAWVTRANDGRWVDVAYITAYAAACGWIAFEWWGWRRPRWPASGDSGG